jgi:uncharacterized membrane protein YedE/YeeE
MTAPWYVYGAFGDGAGLAIALVLGIGFGWFLERGGMGSAKKLAGQFYFTDLAVFKVMFSAIVTAMLGLFWLSRLGWVDLALVYIPETWILPHIAGGAVFGIGFVMGGLCPGTSCVAATTGRLDGMMVVAGMATGIIGFGFVYPWIRTFYESTPRGAFTLPDVLHLPHGVVVFLVVALALAGFAMAERIERLGGRSAFNRGGAQVET